MQRCKRIWLQDGIQKQRSQETKTVNHKPGKVTTKCSGQLFRVNSFFILSPLCLVYFLPQTSCTPSLCTSLRDDSTYWCNGTAEFCCPNGCCITLLPPDDSDLYKFWYFWVGLGASFVLLVLCTAICAFKCYSRHRSRLPWGSGDVSGADFYSTVQDARGLIRPFLTVKQPPTRPGSVLTHPYGASANEDVGLAPLQPPYAPLRPPHTESGNVRRNSDHIASIILPTSAGLSSPGPGPGGLGPHQPSNS